MRRNSSCKHSRRRDSPIWSKPFNTWLVFLVRHEEIAGCVHPNNSRGHRGKDGELLTASRRKLYHAIVARVRDEQVATCVHRQAGRSIEASSGDGPQLAAAILKYLIAVGTRKEDITLLSAAIPDGDGKLPTRTLKAPSAEISSTCPAPKSAT